MPTTYSRRLASTLQFIDFLVNARQSGNTQKNLAATEALVKGTYVYNSSDVSKTTFFMA